MSSIQLEVGKHYVQRDGGVVGPLSRTMGCEELPFTNGFTRWEVTGLHVYDPERDIVAEYQEPTTNQEESTMSNIKLEVGKTYRTEYGDKALCVYELTNDEFVCVYGESGLTKGMYHFSGVFSSSGERPDREDDHIISELTEPPKTKKVLMYQALYKSLADDSTSISAALYDDSSSAESFYGDRFIRLLTDRPVEVEVPV